ncbi:MAG: hypothetical protein B6241_06270 [Spirochaetaceae bacterium 4572_59]|nr:MAG: hypothetical protein B6241_06270 [Spirochaetaceae bacterium 4572_59]
MKQIRFIVLTFLTLLLSSCANEEARIDASGSFEALEIIVSAEATGKIESLDIHEGDQLKEGQVLGKIETVLLELKREQLLASREGMKSRIMNIPIQTAALSQEIETLKAEKIRIENLLKSDAVNTKQLDDIKAQLAMMEKQIYARKVSLNNANQEIQNEMAALNSQIAQVDEQIKNSLICSPITGSVLVKYAEKGEFTINGKGLFKLADLDQMYLRAYITSGQLSRVKLGQTITVLSDFGDKEFRNYKGRITWISDKAEFTPKTVQTKDERANLTYALKVSVPNDGFLKIGMYGGIILDDE